MFLYLGGFSVIDRIAGILRDSGLRRLPFVAARALHGILSASLTVLVLPHLPGDIAVFANGAQTVPMGDANTPVLSICLMMMSALLLMQLPRFQRKR